jgi:hypothetical protein
MLVALIAQSAAAKPPREESPAPRDVLDAFVAAADANGDNELEQAIAAADAHPLGTLANPIRVAGPEGAHAYLARLRCADASLPKIGPAKPGEVDTYGSIVQLYPVDCGASQPPPAVLAFDFYHEEHVERRPPTGFRIQS